MVALRAVRRGVTMRRVKRLSILLTEAPPAEFRVFKAGLNPTENGYSVLFDAAAAASVLEAAKTWGVEMMIDLEHESLTGDPAVRADQKDARGWFQLEVRNGELWAVNVRWTPDGQRRLTEKTQRYVSPAFATEAVEGQPGVERIVAVQNIALTAMPATRSAAPLVAAKRAPLARRVARDTFRRTSMSPETIKAALEAVEGKDGNAALEVLKALLAESAAGPQTPEAKPPESAAVEPSAEVPDPDKEAAALAAQALSVAERTTVENANLKARLLALETVQKKDDDAKRAGLVGQLVEMQVETPATAYGADGKLCKRLALEPVDDMAVRVAEHAKTRPAAIKPPTAKGESGEAGSKDFQTAHGIVTLSASELKACADAKATPEAYASNKAIMTAARRGGSK